MQSDLHVHSDASADGHSTLEELALAARALGRTCLAITDHSRSRPLGLDASAVLSHAEEIRRLDRRLRGRPRLLAGVEVDILADGSLDLPTEVLARLDWVVASIHAGLRDPPEQLTRRMVRAIESGVVDVLGHPGGRLIGTRDPCVFDLQRVLAAARAHGVALEVNAQPERLDLTDQACQLAKAAGVRVAIASDAHLADQLALLRYGVWVARRGWLTADDVLNCADEPLRRAERRRARPGQRPAEGHAAH